jgi:nucleotide-binding universal stress UspA family protein
MDTRMKRILLATDFSELARSAYGAAAALARGYGAEIHLVHVEELLPSLYCEELGPEALRRHYRDNFLPRLEDEARHPALDGLTVTPHLVANGQSHATLTRFAESEAMGLIVMATHGRTGVRHALLGSYAERVVRHSSVPVLVYREPAGAAAPIGAYRPRNVLVPFDFSENARAVLPFVHSIASHFDAHFTFLHVLNPDEFFFERFPTQAAIEEHHKSTTGFILQARKRLEALGESDLAGIPRSSLSFRATVGNVPLGIVERARETHADLVLMATHGWTGLKHLLLGSFAEKVLREAPCPVLTVRPQEVRVGVACPESLEVHAPPR